jgi:hypothetical protein
MSHRHLASPSYYLITTCILNQQLEVNLMVFFFNFILFICAYNVWVLSPPFPLPPPLPLPYPSLPGRNYFALISNFVEERV